MKSWYWHDCFRINCFIKWIAFTKHVQFWTRYDIEYSNMFLLYDLIVTWLLIHDCKTSIASAWLISNHLFRQREYFCKKLNVRTRHDTVFDSIVSSENCIRRAIDHQIFFCCTICSKLDHLFVIIERRSRRDIDMIAFVLSTDFQIRFRCTICSFLDHFFVIIFLSKSMSYKLIREILTKLFFFLALTFSRSETTSKYNFAMNSHFEYFVILSSLCSCLFYYFELCTFNNIANSFAHWFANLIYFWKISTKFERWYFHWIMHVSRANEFSH